jgi:alpha-2-macroglobulin
MRRRPVFPTSALTVLLGLCLLSGVVLAQVDSPTVVNFSPQGETRDVQQVALRFSQDMVALGQADASAPVQLKCDGDPAMSLRWVDPRRWVAEFKKPLPVGTRCTANLLPELRSLAGKVVANAEPWTFNTGGPKVAWSEPYAYSSAKLSDQQVFLLLADAPLARETLRGALHCRVQTKDGKGSMAPAEEMSVTLLDESATKAQWRKERGTASFDFARTVALRCARPLPPQASVRVQWGRSIATLSGAASSNDQTLGPWQVRPPFTARVECGQIVGSSDCDPRQDIRVWFSERVPATALAGASLRSSTGQVFSLEPVVLYDGATLVLWHKHSETKALLPESSTLTFTLPEGLQDVDGRYLTNQQEFPKTLRTATLPPYLGFVNTSGVLPWNEKTQQQRWPLAVRRLEPTVPIQIMRLSGAMRDPEAGGSALQRRAQASAQALALWQSVPTWPQRSAAQMPSAPYPVSQQQNVRWAEVQTQNIHATDVETLNAVPVNLSQVGLYLLEAHSPRFADRLRTVLQGTRIEPEQRASVVQVTNLNLSVRFSNQGDSLLWVTAIDTGLPVADVEVDWFSCSGQLLVQGRTDAQGLMTVKASAKGKDADQSCPKDRSGPALVARKGEDLAILNDIGRIDQYEFNSASRTPYLGHTVLDRSLFRAGETVSMQHLQRQLTAEGFALPEAGTGKVELYFRDGSLVATLPLQWSAAGSATSQWVIPSNAKLGLYTARVTGAQGSVHQIKFQVEEFRTPVFEASLTGRAQWKAGQQHLPLGLHLRYLAGGAAAGELVSVAGEFQPGASPPLPDYAFSDASLPPWTAEPAFTTQTARLNAQGQAQLDPKLPAFDRPMTLIAEMKFSDPNGEVQTVEQYFALWPNAIRLGIRATPQQSTTTPVHPIVKVQTVVLDANDQPLAQQALTLTAQPVRWKYVADTEVLERLEPARTVCSGRSDARGQLSCEWDGLPDKRGDPDTEWLFAVSTQDTAGTSVTSSVLIDSYQLRWAGKAQALTLEADQTQPLAAGEAARLQIQAPFWPSTVLLTVEREGVLHASIHTLTQASSQITLPLLARYAPNVRIRARFVRGLNALNTLNTISQTVSETAPALVEESELWLKIAPDRFALDVQVRAKVPRITPGGATQVTITVRQRQGGQAAAGAQVTLVAVDEALLALKDNASWQLLPAMLRERYDAVIGSALNPLLRLPLDFGARSAYVPLDETLRAPTPMKATVTGFRSAAEGERLAAKGRDGFVHTPARSDFNTLALWRTDVVLDANGQATVPVTFNDSLTRWRIVAVATHGADRFGQGQTNVEVSKDVQLYAGLPPVLRSGDRLTQRVTVRNTGAKSLRLDFSAVASRAPDAAARGLRVRRSLQLAPGQAREVSWPVAVPEGIETLEWTIQAHSNAAKVSDSLQVSQRVLPALPVTVRQATLLQIKGETSLPINRPTDAQAGQAGQGGKSGVRVALSDSLVRSALSEVRRWMRDYPFACLEQKASKLLVAGDAEGWTRLMQDLPKYLDANGLARYFGDAKLTGSETLTAYLLDLSHASGWKIPEDSRQKMLAGLQRAWNTNDPQDWQPDRTAASNSARQLALQATLATQGQLHSVEDLRTRPEDLSLLPTLALVDWARTLLALPATTNSNADLQQVAQQLRGRYDVQGTRLNWHSDSRDAWWWWMWSGDTAVARSVLLIQQWQQRDAAWQADLPLLIQGLIARQQQGRWGTTVANAWGTLALQAFAASHEAEPVTGQTRLALTGTAPVTLKWPQPAATLLRQDKDAGTAQLQLSHQGSGAPWANVSILEAVRLQTPRQSGLQVEKAITPVEQKQAGQWSVGDVARIRLTLQSQADLTWVAVLDPIPSGASILGKGLGRESQLAQQGQTSSGWAWPSFIERASDSYRAYYRWVPRGTWSAEYTVRLNNAGTFALPATRIEAMYAPEIFGETPNVTWEVKTAQER